jgi:hypothetical protein
MMLREKDRILIAAGVDGPLTGHVAKQFRDLIANSPEANALYHSLISDRNRLAALPKPRAPYSIAKNINQRIYPNVNPSSLRASPQRRAATWLPYAFAASVFVVVSAGSFLFFQNDASQRELAERKARTTLPGVHLPLPEPGRALASATNREELPGPNSEQLPLPSNPSIANRDPNPAIKPLTPATTISNDWLTARIVGETPDLQSVSARLPYLFHVPDALQAETKKRLVEEIFAHTAVRLDLFVRDVPKALDVIQTAAKSSSIGTVVVPLTAEQIKRKAPVSIAVFTDSLTAKDHADFLVHIAKADATARTFTQGHLIPASASDARELKLLFGIDSLLKRPNGDETNESPLASNTLGQVKQAIAKDGTKTAIVTTFGPNAARMNAGNSPEIKTFFEKRGERSTSSIPALIVIRHISDK